MIVELKCKRCGGTVGRGYLDLLEITCPACGEKLKFIRPHERFCLDIMNRELSISRGFRMTMSTGYTVPQAELDAEKERILIEGE